MLFLFPLCKAYHYPFLRPETTIVAFSTLHFWRANNITTSFTKGVIHCSTVIGNTLVGLDKSGFRLEICTDKYESTAVHAVCM